MEKPDKYEVVMVVLRVFAYIAVFFGIVVIVAGCSCDTVDDRFKVIDSGLTNSILCDTHEDVSYISFNYGLSVMFGRDGRPLPCNSIRGYKNDRK